MTRAGASLARLGLTGSWAEDTLAQLGWWAGDRPAEGAESVMWALARSPDPDLALRALERLARANARDRKAFDAALRAEVGLRGRLFALLGGSTALADHLVAASRPLAPAAATTPARAPAARPARRRCSRPSARTGRAARGRTGRRRRVAAPGRRP